MTKETHGHCFCGETTFAYQGPELWVGHCHCESCRRNTASPFTTFIGVDIDQYQFTGRQPGVYAMEDGVKRYFCDQCGTPMAYQSPRWPDEMHFYLATLDDPESLLPQFHVNCGEQLSWVKLADGLPCYENNSEE